MINAVSRAASRLDRNWTVGVLLAAGVLFSIAGFIYLGQRQTAVAAAQLRLATGDRADAIRREIHDRAALLEIIVRLLGSPDTNLESVQRIVDSCCRGAGSGVLALWAPWDGAGSPPRDWRLVRRFQAAWSEPADRAPVWFGDGLRRAARSGGMITVPAATNGGGELLVFAAPVFDTRGHLKGVAMVIDRVSAVVERAMASVVPAGLDLVLEDATVGGRHIYTHRSHLDTAPPTSAREFIREAPIHFTDRVWVVRAAPVPGYLSGRDRWARWYLLAATLLATFLAAAVARDILERAARARVLAAFRARRLAPGIQAAPDGSHRVCKQASGPVLVRAESREASSVPSGR